MKQELNLTELSIYTSPTLTVYGAAATLTAASSFKTFDEGTGAGGMEFACMTNMNENRNRC